jgi:hypothetical protein
MPARRHALLTKTRQAGWSTGSLCFSLTGIYLGNVFRQNYYVSMPHTYLGHLGQYDISKTGFICVLSHKVAKASIAGIIWALNQSNFCQATL